MYKEILKSIENVAIWPEISLVIFFSFFIILLWNVVTTDKKYIKYMEQMPLRNVDTEEQMTISAKDKEATKGQSFNNLKDEQNEN